ncbi:hypothetical protein [Sphingomonas sp.]|uniref:hypothetical protein n=1 Tax=Sphingomonas sp. TaxID=28214 RepID=UPI0025D78C4E|nr:hypothetical protein [Sphingomonas sp.]
MSTTSAPPAVTGWGFLDIDAEDYHADPAPRPSMSSGLLATVVTGTIAEAKESHPRLTPREDAEDDNKKFDIGTVAHTLVLGKGREIDIVDADAWTTKAAKEARAASKAAGRTPVLARQYEQAEAMRTALFDQLAVMKGEQDTFTADAGVAEQAGFWQEQTPLGKMWGRALYDWRRTDRLVIRDYKTYNGQQGADPDGFIKGIIGTGKDVQDPWYSRGLAAIAGQEAGEAIPFDAVDFKFIVQDPNPPYLVAVVALNDRHWSNERCQWAIDRWAAAAGANLWRGFVPAVHYVDPPAWAKTQWEQRMLREWEGEQAMLEQGMPALALKEPDAYRVEQAA